MARGDEITTRFNDAQYECTYPDGAEHHYWPRARARILQRQLELLGGAARVGDILDIGCGRGMIVSYLRRWGYSALGCDPGEARPLNQEVKPYLRLGTEAFELPAEMRRQTRLIMLLDVLEHLQEPAPFLSKCAKKFPNCQYVLATLPARQEVWSNYDEYYGHYRRYDWKTARELVAGGEFRIVRMGYFFHLLYAAASALKLARQKRGVVIHSPTPKVRWLHRLLATVFYWEYELTPTWVPGTSLLVVMERRQR